MWDIQTGEIEQTLVGTGTPNWTAAFSGDGQRIAWGTKWQSAPGRRSHPSEASSPLLFQLQLPAAGGSLGRPEPVNDTAAKHSVRARTTYGYYTLSHRKGGGLGYDDAILDIKQGDKVIASIERDSTNGYLHSAYTFSPDGQSIISAGSSGTLDAYDLEGHHLGRFIGHEGESGR